MGVFLLTRTPVKPPGPPDVEKVTVPVQLPEMKVIAVIIDDIGHNHPAARPFIDMEYPVALSFLPDRPFSEELAREASRHGKTVLLHLPMQPIGYPKVDPGPGAILLTQSRQEIQEVLEKDVDSLSGIVGVNNHMGSEATADRRVMETVLKMLGEKGLFFIDSRTTPETVALKMARELGIPSAQRDVFLDNEHQSLAIDTRVDELLDLAEKKGWAIGIGHANSETAKAMDRLALKARDRNISWISLEDLIAYADSGN